MDPAVYLSAWVGDLGLDNGVPQSVYTLDTTNMKRIGIEEMSPGDTWKLPGGVGTLEFTGYKQWASFSITRDGGKGWALAAGLCAILGLTMSLLLPRRKVWLRVTAAEDGRNLCEVAGLSKTEAPGLVTDVERLANLVPGRYED
jgi:cytochrome c biogenesis protein